MIYQLGRGFNKGGIHEICPTISSHSWEQNNFVVEKDIQSLVRRRNEYGKAVRKDYENGNPNNVRMKDIRDWTCKSDGISSTITTVGLDRMVVEFLGEKTCYGAAMRGRYNSEGKVEQQIELMNGTEISNALTTVQKDFLVVETINQRKEK